MKSSYVRRKRTWYFWISIFVEFFREPINKFCLIILQELRPTLDELGISTPEELGYDKPELGLPSPFEIHG